MLFESKEHHQFYLKCMEQSTKNDTYHRALFYTLGINPDTRRNIHEIYDFKTNLIHLNVLRKGWQTSGSYQVCLLAFNLLAIPQRHSQVAVPLMSSLTVWKPLILCRQSRLNFLNDFMKNKKEWNANGEKD